MRHELAITTDYIRDAGSSEPYLKRISQAGFTHIMWCHHFDDDYLYSETEIKQISKWLKDYRLKVTNIHASCGKEKNWISQKEHERKAGIELVKNRISMAFKLSCNTIVMHLHHKPGNKLIRNNYWKIVHKTLDELEIFAKKHNVRIALENMDDITEDGYEIKRLLSEYSSDFLGFCYDTGHENLGNGLSLLETFKDRLIAIHLNDNDGNSSQHRQLFSGTTDWGKVAKLIAESSYNDCMSLEILTKKPGSEEESEFLRKAHELGIKFSKMVDEERKLNKK